MAKVLVEWVETCSYSAEIEVDGYDPDEDLTDEECGVMQAILNLDKDEFDKAFDSVDERSISDVTVVRDGDLIPEIVKAAPAHEEMF